MIILSSDQSIEFNSENSCIYNYDIEHLIIIFKKENSYWKYFNKKKS